MKVHLRSDVVAFDAHDVCRFEEAHKVRSTSEMHGARTSKTLPLVAILLLCIGGCAASAEQSEQLEYKEEQLDKMKAHIANKLVSNMYDAGSISKEAAASAMSTLGLENQPSQEQCRWDTNGNCQVLRC